MRALLTPICNSRVLGRLIVLAAVSVSCASSRRVGPDQSSEGKQRHAAEDGRAEVNPDATSDAGGGAEQTCRGQAPDTCPQSAWEGTEDAATSSGDAGSSVGCAKSDILAELEPEPGTDCGDVPVRATNEATRHALECARDALAASKPFHLFWSVVATDRANQFGVIARRQADSLQTFIVALVRPNTSGSHYKGPNARWTECDDARVICEDSVDRCFKCQPSQREACVCAPANEIGFPPISPNASGFVINCVSLEP